MCRLFVFFLHQHIYFLSNRNRTRYQFKENLRFIIVKFFYRWNNLILEVQYRWSVFKNDKTSFINSVIYLVSLHCFSCLEKACLDAIKFLWFECVWISFLKLYPLPCFLHVTELVSIRHNYFRF